MWQPVIDQTVAILAPCVGAIIVSLLGIGLKRANAWIKAKIESERMQAALIQVSESTVSAVMDLEATMRPMLSDGKLTLDEQRQIKEAALNRIKTHAPTALETLTAAGLKDLDQFIAGKIEKAVAEMPKKPTE
jgi:hypothetical protein